MGAETEWPSWAMESAAGRMVKAQLSGFLASVKDSVEAIVLFEVMKKEAATAPYASSVAETHSEAPSYLVVVVAAMETWSAEACSSLVVVVVVAGAAAASSAADLRTGRGCWAP